jgi:diadenosine tetraphosphatase ApaH/serine/threonine PP2A family protein phosphatase
MQTVKSVRTSAIRRDGPGWRISPRTYSRQYDDRLILNPGSVGQPRDGDARAAYAVVDTESWETDLRRTAYNVDSVQETVRSVGLPRGVGERLASGR